MRRTFAQVERYGYASGYQAAMFDISTALANGGEEAVREWLKNNTTNETRKALVEQAEQAETSGV